MNYLHHIVEHAFNPNTGGGEQMSMSSSVPSLPYRFLGKPGWHDETLPKIEKTKRKPDQASKQANTHKLHPHM